MICLALSWMSDFSTDWLDNLFSISWTSEPITSFYFIFGRYVLPTSHSARLCCMIQWGLIDALIRCFLAVTFQIWWSVMFLIRWAHIQRRQESGRRTKSDSWLRKGSKKQSWRTIRQKTQRLPRILRFLRIHRNIRIQKYTEFNKS